MSFARIVCVVSLVFGFAAPSRGQEIVLAFDDLAVQDLKVGESYAAQGVHFSPTEFGLKDGLGYTDDGGWGLEGTRGSWFQGFNGSPGYAMTLTFDGPVAGFALDVSRSAGSTSDSTFTISAFLGAELVESQTVPLPGVNSWVPIAIAASEIDRVEWSSAGTTSFYGVDNVRFTFVPQLDRFKCYKAADAKDPAKFPGAEVELAGSLETKLTSVRKPVAWCEPVDQAGEGIANPAARLLCYQIKDAKTSPPQPKFQKRELAAADGFGELGLLLSKSTTLCVPAAEAP
jgi:hypothetical protein